MKNKRKLLLMFSFILLIIFGTTFTVCNSFAGSNTKVVAASSDMDYLYDFKIVSGNILTPAYIKYDGTYFSSRDENIIFTENQERTGLCWAYGAVKAYEIMIATQQNEVCNISEAWISLCKKMENSSYKIAAGGRSTEVINLIKKYGIVYENDMPIDVIYHIDDTNYLQYYDLYSQYAFKLPVDIETKNFEDYTTDKAWGTDNYLNNSKMMTIKNHILKYGAAIASVNSNYAVKLKQKEIVYNNKPSTSTNHAVTIIGWDDKFTITSKTSGETHVGAWIGLNTYGNGSSIDGMFYLMYDDVLAPKTFYGYIPKTTSQNLKISISQTKAYFVNPDAYEYYSVALNEGKVCKQKNVFEYGRNFGLTYQLSPSTTYKSYKITATLMKDNFIVKDISDKISSNTLVIDDSIISDYGKYAILFSYDKENDGVIDEKYYKEIVKLDGTEFLNCSTSSSLATPHNSCNTSEKTIYSFCNHNQSKVYLRLNLSSYSKLYDVTASSGVTVDKNNFSPAGSGNFATGYIDLVVNNITVYKKYSFTLTLSGFDDTRSNYKLVVYKIGTNDTMAYVDYFTNYQNGNANVKVFAIGENYSMPTIYSATKDGYYFDGWTTDKNLTNVIAGDNNNGYTLAKDYFTFTSGKNNYTDFMNPANGATFSNCEKYTLILYPKFVIDDFNFTSYKINTSCEYNRSFSHKINSVSGGSGSFTYSVVSNMPSGLSLNPQTGVISGTPKVGGKFDIVIKVKDNERNQTKEATLSLYVNKSNLGLYQATWMDTLTNKKCSQNGSFTFPTAGPGAHGAQVHVIALSVDGVLSVTTRSYKNLPTYKLPQGYKLSNITILYSSGGGSFTAKTINFGESVSVTPIEYTGGADAAIIYQFNCIPCYQVSYYLSGNTVWQSETVTHGDTYTLKNVPTSDYLSGYTFAGWSENQSATVDANVGSTKQCTREKSWYAVWSKKLKFTIHYEANGVDASMPADSSTNEYTQYYDYNIYMYANTIKTSFVVANSLTNLASHNFIGWNVFADGKGESLQPGSTQTVSLGFNSETLTVYAIWQKRSYSIKWLNYDGSTLSTKQVEYGTTPTYNGETPTKSGNAQYTYTFDGWTPEVSAVTENATYTAKYTTITNKYSITWQNFDGTTLRTEQVEYGTMPTYSGETPTKSGNAQYTYTFAGWTPEVVNATTDATYTATFTAQGVIYQVVFEQNNLDTDEKILTDNKGNLLANKTILTGKMEYNQSYQDLMSNDNTPLQFPSISIEGYEFLGWYTQRVGGEKVELTDKFTGTSDLTLYAHWKNVQSQNSDTIVIVLAIVGAIVVVSGVVYLVIRNKKKKMER